jgi:photosystem I subunit 8
MAVGKATGTASCERPLEGGLEEMATAALEGVRGLRRGLNFYVAPQQRQGSLSDLSVQYRRFLLAYAMTGEFAAAWLPSVFVPLVGILGPAVAMALLFNVIEATD